MQSYLACRYIKMCVLTRYIFCETLVKICSQTQMPVYFSDIGQCCRLVSKIKNPAPLRSTNMIYLIHIAFSNLYISWCRLERGHRRRRQTEFQNYRKTDISQNCLKRAYIPTRQFERPKTLPVQLTCMIRLTLILLVYLLFNLCCFLFYNNRQIDRC